MYIDNKNNLEQNVGDRIRKTLRNNVPVRSKSIWTKNEAELVDLFSQYFLLNQTTKDEIETFLRNNRVSFELSKQNTLIYSPIEKQKDYHVSDEIRIVLPGPPVWGEDEGLLGLLPYGSQYQVRFHFIANALYKISATLVVYHF